MVSRPSCSSADRRPRGLRLRYGYEGVHHECQRHRVQGAMLQRRWWRWDIRGGTALARWLFFRGAYEAARPTDSRSWHGGDVGEARDLSARSSSRLRSLPLRRSGAPPGDILRSPAWFRSTGAAYRILLVGIPPRRLLGGLCAEESSAPRARSARGGRPRRLGLLSSSLDSSVGLAFTIHR
jgi:hypothetical protein